MNFEPKDQQSAFDEIMAKINALQEDVELVEKTQDLIRAHEKKMEESEEPSCGVVDEDLFDEIRKQRDFSGEKSPLKRMIHGVEDDNDEDEIPNRPVFDDTEAEDIEDYEDQEDRDEIYRDLKNTVGKMAVKSVVFLIISIITTYLFISGFVPSLFAYGTESAWFDASFLAVDIACIIFSFGIFIEGLGALLRAKANTDTLLALLAISVLGVRIAAIIRPDVLPSTLNLELILSLGLYFNVVAKKRIASNIKNNFKKLSVSSDKLTVSVPPAVETNNRLILETGEGGEVMYAHRTGLVSGCIERCFSDYECDHKLYRFLFLTIFLIIAGTVAVFQLAGWQAGLLFPAAAFSISVPFFSRHYYATSVLKVGKKVRKNGGVLISAQAAKDLEDSDLMIISEEDFLGDEAVLLQGIKAIGDMEIDTLITNIAALFKEVGTPIQSLFMKMIDQKSIELPRVDDIYCHEGMGYSALIHSKMFLIGNELLMNHFNIEIPEQFKKMELKECYYPVYVAYHKSAVGIFLVSFERDPNTEAAIRLADEEQVSVGLISNDFLFNEALLKKLYPQINMELFHFVTPETAFGCKEYLKRKSKSSDLIASTSRARGLLASLYGASKLLTALKINGIIRIIYAILSIVLMFFIALAGYSDNTALQILAFQTIWFLPVCAICIICK